MNDVSTNTCTWHFVTCNRCGVFLPSQEVNALFRLFDTRGDGHADAEVFFAICAFCCSELWTRKGKLGHLVLASNTVHARMIDPSRRDYVFVYSHSPMTQCISRPFRAKKLVPRVREACDEEEGVLQVPLQSILTKISGHTYPYDLALILDRLPKGDLQHHFRTKILSKVIEVSPLSLVTSGAFQDSSRNDAVNVSL